MGAIRFPLTSDSQSAPNQASPQEAATLPARLAGRSTVLRPDVVTLSAVFPPAQPVVAPNFVQFESTSLPAVQAFPPRLPNDEPAQSARAAITTAPAALTQQQRLAQLNQTLLQLGISPQSISLDNRLALLQSANDPAALLNLVHALGALGGPSAIGGSSAQTLSTSSANNLSNPAQAATAQAQLPAPAQSQSLSPAGSGFASTLDISATQSNSVVTQGFSQQASANQSVAPAGNSAAQFRELQLTLQAVESSQATPPNRNSVPNGANQQAPPLNVKA
jgi:hypothetical protein